jgi:hypothetical protein
VGAVLCRERHCGFQGGKWLRQSLDLLLKECDFEAYSNNVCLAVSVLFQVPAG